MVGCTTPWWSWGLLPFEEIQSTMNWVPWHESRRLRMRELSELNIRHFGSRRAMPPPTLDQIAFVENLIGAKLPSSYIAFLMFSNGGYPELDTFYDTTEGSGEEWAVDHFLHISSDLDSTNNVVWQYQHRWSGAPKEILPIADDGLGDLICLDLTELGKGRVIVWVHDDPDLPIVEVADSFEEFVDSLALPPDSS
jgi:hypothetical protein